MTGAPGQASAGRDQQYLAYAEAYTEAAKRLADRADDMDVVSTPFFHLVAHALELMLKAVLSCQGRDEERLMMMGHSLERCYAQAIRGGADRLEDEDLAAFVEALDQPHAMQALRYPQWLHGPMPEPAQAVRLLSRQLDIVRTWLANEH
ncbi:hypothetical protein HGO34_06965 [Agrobacterium vitis]|uniref:HEPN domain-containing protein n=1 Tax=Agrobacterium vitis TaxID=373 RepID=A0AAE4WDK3_AGRVI|nr:hypothetical protein [Agrobacterium vitis]MCF1499296.1 hypothetical protein [Allorhizobium sp. Av2]MCM2439456.1 hypothetical protein [Agrobacterium vitis]MUZ57643.1 hypothetical protein [Agrobacterium vitis]